jgi:hypothetical protein
MQCNISFLYLIYLYIIRSLKYFTYKFYLKFTITFIKNKRSFDIKLKNWFLYQNLF